MTGGRQLQLDRRENFFSDPFFGDILALEDKDLHSRLDTFKAKSALVSAGGVQEEAHNLQVSCSNDKFMIQLELPGFQPDDFSLKTKDDQIVLEADSKGQKASDGSEVTSRTYKKEFKMPEGVQPEHLKSYYTADGILTIEAPRQLTAPEGGTIQEAMAAKSKAYSTDDGRTNVKEDSQASSQMIAATTESPDGRTKSSMSYSSSSSSSSTMTSTMGGPGGMSMGMQPMRGMGMQMPQMPSLGGMGGGMGQMSLDMDDMMKKMMSDMNMGGSAGGSLMDKMSSNMSSTSSSMQKSSFSSSSSSTQQQSSSMLGGMGGPSLGLSMNMPAGFGKGLDIEELSTAGSDFSTNDPPRYTVTSPPPTASSQKASAGFPESTSHNVQPSADFKTMKDPQADCTVLLKLRGGDEYKLVLNMQQYKPENITVKLNDRELNIYAHDAKHTEDFHQKHLVPEGVDLDQLSSTFSSDGILVIKAPKMK